MIRIAGQESLHCSVTCETYDVPGYAIDDMNQYSGFEKAETIQTAAVQDPESGDVTVFVLNADLEEGQELTMDLRGFGGLTLQEHTEMYAEDPEARNTFETPGVLIPRQNRETALEGGILTAWLKKSSWNVFRLAGQRKR
jgi:alpha-N-arabinofuranosidase